MKRCVGSFGLVTFLFIVMFLFFLGVSIGYTQDTKIDTMWSKVKIDNTVYDYISDFSRDGFVSVINLNDKGFMFIPHEWRVSSNPFVWNYEIGDYTAVMNVIFEPLLLIQSSFDNYTENRKSVLHNITSKTITQQAQDQGGVLVVVEPVRIFDFDGLRVVVVKASYVSKDSNNRTLFNCVVPNGNESFVIIMDLSTELTSDLYVEGIFSSLYINGITI